MSAAAELRAAASMLRESADGATPGPWRWKPAIPGKLGPQHDASLTWPSGYFTSGYDIWIRDAVYITMMDPIVGAALADLLDEVAENEAAHVAHSPSALAIARLINGSAS